MKCIYLKKGNNTFTAKRDESQNAGMNAFLSVAQRKPCEKNADKEWRIREGIEIFLSVKHFQQAEQMIETLKRIKSAGRRQDASAFSNFNHFPPCSRIRTKSDQLNMFGHKFFFYFWHFLTYHWYSQSRLCWFWPSRDSFYCCCCCVFLRRDCASYWSFAF